MMKEPKDTVSCNFCGKTNYAVELLVAAPDGTHICNECIDLSAKVAVYHHYRIVLFQGNHIADKE